LLLGCFPPGFSSRTCVFTLNEHISIDMYDPQTDIQSCCLDITASPDFHRLSLCSGPFSANALFSIGFVE
jgi:hypothetical protein